MTFDAPCAPCQCQCVWMVHTFDAKGTERIRRMAIRVNEIELSRSSWHVNYFSQIKSILWIRCRNQWHGNILLDRQICERVYWMNALYWVRSAYRFRFSWLSTMTNCDFQFSNLGWNENERLSFSKRVQCSFGSNNIRTYFNYDSDRRYSKAQT